MATGATLPPRTGSVNGLDIMDPAMGYIDTNLKVGDYTVGPGFRDHLEHFYNKASVEDKARCLALLTSLDIGQAAKQLANEDPTLGANNAHNARRPPRGPKRPKTAMAAVETSRAALPRGQPLGPYTTTYGREYSGLPGAAAYAERPASTRAYQASYELSGPVGTSSYQNDYYHKNQRKTNPIRTGSSSGNRRNNPHPLETFINWRLPPRPAASEWNGELTDEILDAVCRGRIRSTYQQDYLGFPQGFQPSAPVNLPDDWKSKVKYSLESSTRRCYQSPSQQVDLKGNTSRYGCNKLKGVPANGVVPTVSSRQMHLKNRTSYEMDYDENDAAHDVQDLRDLGKLHAAAALQGHAGAAHAPAKPVPVLRPIAPSAPQEANKPANPFLRPIGPPEVNSLKMTSPKKPKLPPTNAPWLSDALDSWEQLQAQRRRRFQAHDGNAGRGAASPIFPPSVQRLRADLHALQAGRPTIPGRGAR